jgi:hypothetical protein
MPALLHAQSRRPYNLMVALTSTSTEETSRTSAQTKLAAPPLEPISWIVRPP